VAELGKGAPQAQGPALEGSAEELTVAWGPVEDSRGAFEAIVTRHMKDAYFIALGLVGNKEDALELSQEAFYRAFKNYGRLNAKDKFFPWFYQILKNLCFSHLRKRKVRRNYQLQIADCELPIGEPEANSQSAICNSQLDEGQDEFDPEAIAERNESKDRIWRAISRLDEKHREVIILRHFRNLSYDEMAKLLFCNRGTVTSRLYYARQRLKEILDEDTMGAPPKAADDSEVPKGGQTL
jgi:RNA polymerase sigma-70 factor (ECF subfamily)